MAWMPVLFHKDNMISLLKGNREGMSLVGVGGTVSIMLDSWNNIREFKVV